MQATYAIYLRKSRADVEKEKFGEYETLAKHEKELIELARRYKYVVSDVYKELVSGEHISERQEFQKMMKCVSEGKYVGVIVHSISRLGRGNPFEYGWTLLTLQMSNTVIITPSKVYDPNDEDDARYLQMEMFINNMELGNIKSRMVSGERAAARAGCFIKPMPAYGYDRIKIDGNWTLTPNDDAPVVKLIFEQAAAGVSHGTIARELNESLIPTATGKRWCASRVLSIIKNPHYKGMIRYGYYKNEKVLGDGFQMKRVQSFNEDCIMVEGLHEGIVSKEVWQEANDHISPAPAIPGGRTIKNPLAGLLVCSKCGRTMIRFLNTCPSNGHKIEHYRHAYFTDCHMRGANMELVVSMVADALKETATKITMNAKEQQHITEEEIKAVKKELESSRKMIDKLLELFFANAITIDEFKSRRSQTEETITVLENKLEELTRTRRPVKEIAFSLNTAAGLLKDSAASPAEKNQALKSVISKIEFDNHTVGRKEVDIRLNIVLKD